MTQPDCTKDNITFNYGNQAGNPGDLSEWIIQQPADKALRLGYCLP